MVNNPELGLPAAERSEGAKTVVSVSRPEHPTRQMAALRARRVARLAREQAAVRRRVVMAGFASVLLLLFTVLAAVGVMSWLWLIVPAVLLVATVGSSVAGSFRAQSQSRDEVEELARLFRNEFADLHGECCTGLGDVEFLGTVVLGGRFASEKMMGFHLVDDPPHGRPVLHGQVGDYGGPDARMAVDEKERCDLPRALGHVETVQTFVEIPGYREAERSNVEAQRISQDIEIDLLDGGWRLYRWFRHYVPVFS